MTDDTSSQDHASASVKGVHGLVTGAAGRPHDARQLACLVVILAFFPIVWLLLELFVAIQVAHAIGALYTVLLLIVSWPLGGWILRAQGRAAWRRLSAATSAGRSPGHEVLDGVLVLIGALLLIVPGFLSDLVGLCALFPPTRSLLRGRIARHLHSRFFLRATRTGGVGRAYDVDSTATDVDQSQLPA